MKTNITRQYCNVCPAAHGITSAPPKDVCTVLWYFHEKDDGTVEEKPPIMEKKCSAHAHLTDDEALNELMRLQIEHSKSIENIMKDHEKIEDGSLS